jgi:N-acetylglucosaminyldiphosphoundecaprenol N-acetyl-beta-D-mannosaminyltransferase
MDRHAGGVARRELLGITFDAVGMTRAVRRCTDAVEQKRYLSVGMVNAAKVVAMRKDDLLRGAVARCGMVLADGQSVVWASQLLGSPLPERVAGIDLFTMLLAQAAQRGYRVYFLGARPDVLRRMLAEVGREYPNLIVAGARDGYFGPDEQSGVVAEILRCAPDLLFLGMSSPGKELFGDQWGERTGASVVHGVGGSFDILAGLTRRAPLWWQRHGLEWLYRTWQEPARLGRRYLTTNASFMTMVVREALGRRWRSGARSGRRAARSGPPPGSRSQSPGEWP